MATHGPGADLAVVIPCSKAKRRLPLAEHSRGRLDAVPARELYLGRQHRAMVCAVDEFRSVRRDLVVHLHIVSAGHGLLAEDDRLGPYEATLGGSRTDQLARGAQLGLPGAVRVLSGSARYFIVALSSAYLAACQLPSPALTNAVYVAGAALKTTGAPVIAAGRVEARRFGKAERDIRGHVLGLLLKDVGRRGLIALDEALRGSWAWPPDDQLALMRA
jgi:hypothetical protein